MKKIIVVILAVITLLTSCVSTAFLDSKSPTDSKNLEEISESQHRAEINQSIITYYVQGVGGNIAVKIGNKEVKAATQLKNSISVEKGKKITFIAYPEENYEVDTWSIPFANTAKQNVDLVVAENTDIYVIFKQKKLTTTKTESDNYRSTSSNYYNSSRKIYTGPRGGQYYINKNGNKTYIKKNRR